MQLNLKSLEERIVEMSDSELEKLATSEAIAIAESSRIEGLVLDRDKIRSELLAGYKAIKAGNNHSSDPNS